MHEEAGSFKTVIQVTSQRHRGVRLKSRQWLFWVDIDPAQHHS